METTVSKSYGSRSLSYYSPAFVTNTFEAPHAGQYQLNVDLMVNEKYVDDVFDYNKCQLIFRVDGRELLKKEFSWEGGKPYHFNYDQDWTAGNHQLDFELQPLTPGLAQGRTLSLQITAVTVHGPMAKEYAVRPKNYARFFPKDVPETAAARRAYARELLGDFARRAFRRPVDNDTSDRLASLAESVYEQPGKTFEAGVAEAMVAVLASPRFIFREENVEPDGGQPYALVDEYALASRLSYFLWSSMPDEELFQQAAAGTLRKNLSSQVARMLADKRAVALEKNFVGQWLQARDIETVPIEARSVLAREQKFDPQQDAQRQRFRELNDKPEEKLTQRGKSRAGLPAHDLVPFAWATARRPDAGFAPGDAAGDGGCFCLHFARRPQPAWNCWTVITRSSMNVWRSITASPTWSVRRCAVSRCRRTVRAAAS